MIISKTPMRVSFFGGGTDFKEFFEEYSGAVLSTTIDKYCYVHLRKLPPYFNYRNEIIYSKIERVETINEIIHPLVRECLKFKNVNDVHLAYDADLPARTGLATSSAFSVGLLNACNAYKGIYSDRRNLANEAIYLERTLCAERGGIQDQIASSFGGFNLIEFSKDGYEVTPVPLRESRKIQLENNLFLYFTGTVRTSSDVQKAVKINDTEVTDTLLKMKSLVYKAKEILLDESKPIDLFGELLDVTWNLKKRISSKITKPELDQIYNQAKQSGALGGKLLGAGNGGFFLFYVPKDNQHSFKQKMSNLLEVPFKFEYNGASISYFNYSN